MRGRLLVLCLMASAAACHGVSVDGTRPGDDCEAPYPIGTVTAQTVFCADPALLVPADVVRIIDGDTLRAMVGGREEPVRFYGIDTPERGERCFREATDRTRELAGNRVRLLPDARDRDRNKRLLRYVFTDSGRSIDAALIAEGLALAWREDGMRRDTLVELEAEARAKHAGCLWSD